MRTLGLLVIVLLVLAAACGSSGSKLTGSAGRPPEVLATLPEGRLLIQGALAGVPPDETFVIEGKSVATLALTGVAVSADGRYAAYVEARGDFPTPPTPTAVVVRQPDGREVFRLPVSTAAVSHLVWSPSGDLLAFQFDKSVYIVAGATGEQRKYDAAPGAWAVSWLGGPSSLFSEATKGAGTNDRTRYFRMDASSGAWSELFLPTGAYPQFSFSPDGKYYTYATGDNCFFRCDLWVAETTGTRSPCLIMKNAPANQYPQVPGWSPDGRWLTYFAQADFHTVGNGDLRVFDPVTCKDEMGLKDVSEHVWSPDGRDLALTTKSAPDFSQHLHVWHPGGAVQALEIVVSLLQWSHDGATLAAQTDSGLTLIDAASGRTTAIQIRDPSRNRESPSLLWSPSDQYLLISRFEYAIPPFSLGPGATPPPGKPFLLTPQPGEPGAAWMQIIDRETGEVRMLVSEQRQFVASAWIP